MKRIISLILMIILCTSVFGLSAYAGLDLSSYEAFKAQAAGKVAPTPVPTADTRSLAGKLNELVNQIENSKSPDAVTSASKKSLSPSANDIIAIGLDGMIKMPHEDYYLDKYLKGYIYDSSYGLNVRVYRNPDNGIKDSNMMPKAWHGSEVTLLAKRHDFYCITYYTHLNELSAGWVHEDDLCRSFPGDWYAKGEKNESLYAGEYYTVRPQVEPSDEFMVDSYTEYSDVWCPGECISMTLEYQVIGRNDKWPASTYHDVYINPGDGWIYIGSFKVNESLDPVRYTVYFNEPVDVRAIAVLPEDMNQQGFDFRLCIPEMDYIF